MITEKTLRTQELARLWAQYITAQAAGEPQLCNAIIRQMLPHCDRLHLSLFDYLQAQAGQPLPAPPPAAPPPVPVPAVVHQVPAAPEQIRPAGPLFNCVECGASYTEAARYWGHISSHKRAKKAGVTL